MPRVSAVLTMTLVLISHSSFAQNEGTMASELSCDIGPVPQSIGGGQWLAYSCSDSRSVVVVAAPNNPAAPFYFMFQATANGHHLIGEGTGSKAATDEAYKALNALSEKQIDDLIARTRAVGREN